MSKDSYIGHCKLLKTDVTKDTAEERAYSFIHSDLDNIKISDDVSNFDILQYENPENIEKENKAVKLNKD